MTKDVQDAVTILKNAICESGGINCYSPRQHVQVFWFLQNAIRHIAYPDRDTYPKTRKGTKGAPIVRR